MTQVSPTTHTLNTLKARGYRITPARTAIVDTLCGNHTPQTIQEVASAVTVDEVTVYRTISLLLKESLIEEIPLQGGDTRYALGHGHHHHLVCTTCNYIEHLPCTFTKLPAPTSKQFARINHHEVTYYGTCKRCVV